MIDLRCDRVGYVEAGHRLGAEQLDRGQPSKQRVAEQAGSNGGLRVEVPAEVGHAGRVEDHVRIDLDEVRSLDTTRCAVEGPVERLDRLDHDRLRDPECLSGNAWRAHAPWSFRRG